MRKFFKYTLPVIGLGLSIIGLISLDNFKIFCGLLIFFSCFAFDYWKRRKMLKDDNIFRPYQVINDLIILIEKSIHAVVSDYNKEKLKLVKGMFYLGFIGAASQVYKLTDKQFLELFDTIAEDYDYTKEERTKLLLINQQDFSDDKHFVLRKNGGEIFIKFINGNKSAILASPLMMKEMCDDKDIFNSIDELLNAIIDYAIEKEKDKKFLN